MKFQIYSTSGNMKKYIDKLKKYNLLHNTKEERGTYFTRNYFIEIKNLQELCDLSNELNEGIIFWDDDDCLEIYDDYRE